MVSSPWTEEWQEVCRAVLHSTSTLKGHLTSHEQFAKTMGAPPVLPEDLELQQAAANQIFTTLAGLQPPLPETIISSPSSRECFIPLAC